MLQRFTVRRGAPLAWHQTVVGPITVRKIRLYAVPVEHRGGDVQRILRRCRLRLMIGRDRAMLDLPEGSVRLPVIDLLLNGAALAIESTDNITIAFDSTRRLWPSRNTELVVELVELRQSAPEKTES